MAESALRGLVPRPQEIVAPTRSWNPLNPAFRDTVSSAVSNLLGSSNIAGREGYDRSRYADMLTGSVDFVPGVSEAAGVGDVRREVSQGNYPGAALAGVATALGVVPVIGDAAAKAVRGLDMSQAARMQRAQEQGFDTEQVYYHGTSSDFDSFRPSKTGEFGPAVYLTTSPREASSYSKTNTQGANAGQNVIPVMIRANNLFDANEKDFWSVFKSATDSEAIEKAKAAGYSGIRFRRPVSYWDDSLKKVVDTGEMQDHIALFDPANIRSINAAFDPEKRGSANLMAGVGGVLAGGSALRALLPQEQERQPD